MARPKRGEVGLVVGTDLRPRALMPGWALYSPSRAVSYLVVEVNDYRIVVRSRRGAKGGRWSDQLHDVTTSELIGFRVFKDGQVKFSRQRGSRLRESTVERYARRARADAGKPRPKRHRRPAHLHRWVSVSPGLERCEWPTCGMERTFHKLPGARVQERYWLRGQRIHVKKRRVPPCRRGRD